MPKPNKLQLFQNNSRNPSAANTECNYRTVANKKGDNFANASLNYGAYSFIIERTQLSTNSPLSNSLYTVLKTFTRKSFAMLKKLEAFL